MLGVSASLADVPLKEASSEGMSVILMKTVLAKTPRRPASAYMDFVGTSQRISMNVTRRKTAKRWPNVKERTAIAQETYVNFTAIPRRIVSRASSGAVKNLDTHANVRKACANSKS